MKNKLLAVITRLGIIIGACFLLTSFSPSLDGRAVVVEDGVFPKGLFAKTVGYLPGDIISVANIAGDASVDILVIGALDPSEGVAIMLTPEAAEAIGISKNANNIVKITKRSGQDERVYGTAVIAKSEKNIYDEEKTPEEPKVEETIEPPVEEGFEQLVEDDVLPSKKPSEEPAKPEYYAEDFTDPVPSDKKDYETIAATTVEDDSFPDPVPEYVEEYSDDPLPPSSDSRFDEKAVVPSKAVAEQYADSPLSDVEKRVEKDNGEYFVADEIDDLPTKTDILNDDIKTEEFVEENVESFEEPLSELSEVLPAREPFVEEESPSSEEYVDNEEFADLPAGTPMEEYEAIVLVPTENNPPEATNPVVEEEDEVVLVDEPPVSVEPEPETEPAPETKNVVIVQNNVTNITLEKYMVSSAKELKKGKYYVQIAAMGDDTNITDIIERYGKNYPITLVPVSTGKTKQILVGPLSVDEYKVVLERFKSYGYKDAFMRKIR